MNLLILFGLSFLAGSFIPLGSEAYFIYLFEIGEDPYPLIISASLGNTLGGMTCYGIARVWGRPGILKILREKQDRLRLWESRLSGKGEWLAILCWLPFIGEIIAAVLGLFSNKSIRILFFMLVGKFLRYLLLLMVISDLKQG